MFSRKSTDITGTMTCGGAGFGDPAVGFTKWCYCQPWTPAPTPSPTPAPTSVDCVGKWGKWKPCSKTCGQGVKTRSYTVVQAAAFGGAACDMAATTAACWTGKCPTPVPTVPPTPAPGTCASMSVKTDKQCLSKCNSA